MARKLSDSHGEGRSVLYEQRRLSSGSRTALGGMSAYKLSTILRQVELGKLEQWADLCSYMLQTDPHIRSVVMTRIQAVAGADLIIGEGAGDELIRTSIDRMRSWEDRFADLLYGSMVGLSALEIEWRTKNGVTLPQLHFIEPRDLEVQIDGKVRIRTYESGYAQWLDPAEHPNRFVIHRPHNFSDTSELTAELRAVAWPWFFKRTIEKFGLDGFGRLANGLLYGRVNEQADQATTDARRDQLESLAADGVAVFRMKPGDPDPVSLLEAARDPGASTETLIKLYNGEISKALLGSGLNVEVGSTGGNRALGESQFATTTLPRLVADGKRALSSLRHQMWAPMLRFNRLGGADVPTVEVQLVSEDSEPDAAMLTLGVQAGVITRDELREMIGLEPLGDDRPAALPTAAPAFSRDEASAEEGGGDAPDPFSSSSQTRLSRALSAALGARRR